MGRSGRSPPAAPMLPRVEFEKIEDNSTQPGGVHDLQARSYGCKLLQYSLNCVLMRSQTMTSLTSCDPSTIFAI